MFEIFALGIYSVQWLGIVLGVGAEVVLLCAHLINLHERKPQWLASIPAVRAAQFVGLFLIVFSGGGAVAYQFLVDQPQLLLLPVFGFKWALIVVLVVAYMLEKHVVHGHAALEGFTGATWLALFMVHSLAPLSPWLDLLAFYAAWLIVFGLGWGMFILLMRGTSKAPATALVSAAHPVAAVVEKPVVKIVPPIVKPVVVAQPPPPPAPKPVSTPIVVAQPAPVHVAMPVPPVAPPAPAPTPIHVAAPAPVVVAKKEEPVVVIKPIVKKESLWHKLTSLFAKKPKAVLAPAPIVVSAPIKPIEPTPKPVIPPPPPPPPASVPKPVPPVAPPVPPAPVAVAKEVKEAPHVPAGLPVVEPLELMPPHAILVAKPVAEALYVPDYNHIPGLRIMPQRVEDLHLHNRAPLVQPA